MLTRAGLVYPKVVTRINSASTQLAYDLTRKTQISGSVSAQNVLFDGAFTDGVAKLRNLGVPQELIGCVDPKTQSNLLKVAFNQFNPANAGESVGGSSSSGAFNVSA